jgi:hypothetical protein
MAASVSSTDCAIHHFSLPVNQNRQQREELCVRVQLQSFDRAGSVTHHPERPLCRDRRIELLEGTGRRIARICERWQTRFLALRIQFREAFLVHEDFAAHFQQRRVVCPSDVPELSGSSAHFA